MVMQLVVQVDTVPAQHANPSSQTMLQSSSAPLHTSVATHAPQPHPALQVSVPDPPQEVRHGRIAPGLHVKPSSTVPSQSSSIPLQISAGGEQLPHAQVALQVRVPVEPHEVVQLPMLPRTHAKDSSIDASQSSSAALQLSTGGVQLPQVHAELQVRVPVDPHVLVHEPLVPRAQANPSSGVPSQSSSAPLQSSAGGRHAPQAHEAEQVRLPMVPQVVGHPPMLPRMQVKPSSAAPSQSSSIALQDSAGGVHIPQVHIALHVLDPVVPQVVLHGPMVPALHSTSSSTEPSQSSSMPLHASAGGSHIP
jgi:hypothetical protein